jgi:DNA-binding transcriptional MocR family regulator
VEISIDRDSSEPIFRQIVREIQGLIRSGSLPEGFLLPPERRLAAALGVNRSTVFNAYRELKALGLVDAHVGRGTAVLRAPAPIPDAIGVPWRQLFRESVARSHDPIIADLLALTEREDVISFSIGLPAPELLPLDTFGEYTAELIREVGASLLLHCPTEGHSPLRETLAQWVAARGIRARASDVLVVSGSQQGLDLVARIFFDPGDVVIVEEPTYIGALQSFRVAGAKIIGIPVDGDGMRTDILASILERERPKLIYTLPTYQNPSGAVMSVDRRRHLLDLASRWHVPILEDDPYSELRYEGEPLPSLKALDDNELVLYLSTFSKALFPGLRIGYLVVPPVVLRQLALARLTSRNRKRSTAGAVIGWWRLCRGMRRSASNSRFRQEASTSGVVCRLGWNSRPCWPMPPRAASSFSPGEPAIRPSRPRAVSASTSRTHRRRTSTSASRDSSRPCVRRGCGVG